MQATSLHQIAAWTGGKLIQGVPSDVVTVVSTDSRGLSGGEMFLAIKGERFDGHDFIDQAAEHGAASVMVGQLNLATERFGGGIIHVRNPVTALQELALNYRRARRDVFGVGITGSNGKTSTKDFLTAVLSLAGPVNATIGNLNNHLGLPLTILRTEAEHRAGVWEMGMSHPGEIEVLAEIAAPDAAVITNIGTAHIEHMKSREAIALEKGMLVESIGKDGFVVLPARDDYTPSLASRCRGRVVTAGIGRGDVSATNLCPSAAGTRFQIEARGESVAAELPVPGEHMVGNALLAAAVGLERGLGLREIVEALSRAVVTGGRLQRRVVNGIDFLDDSYNANPDSMRAALRTLMSIDVPGRRLAVLGRMAELGDLESEEHRSLGLFAAESGIDLLVAVGEAGALMIDGAAGAVNSMGCATHDEAAAKLREELKPGDLVLLKGSRSSAMEKVIEALGGETQGH
ncbi:MAG: UDP-N-acetylmuramoyl-tripeptide--D-alanyl-D-alanine ligase [Verrucomicrobiae bacterium]|nr:UDP-N-acetylmuramoyl-tripeptide--D-alanyl-D-alanine ligase [Verrucomicrobiae bacterium]